MLVLVSPHYDDGDSEAVDEGDGGDDSDGGYVWMVVAADKSERSQGSGLSFLVTKCSWW